MWVQSLSVCVCVYVFGCHSFVVCGGYLSHIINIWALIVDLALASQIFQHSKLIRNPSFTNNHTQFPIQELPLVKLVGLYWTQFSACNIKIECIAEYLTHNMTIITTIHCHSYSTNDWNDSTLFNKSCLLTFQLIRLRFNLKKKLCLLGNSRKWPWKSWLKLQVNLARPSQQDQKVGFMLAC